MKGFKLQYGIWNFKHSITSRDVARPEIYKSKDEITKVLSEKRRGYAAVGYEFWYTNTTEVDIRLCDECDKHCEVHGLCWYCGAEK